MKQINFKKDAHSKMQNGLNTLNEAVASTLGAKGKNVIFQQGSKYVITKDGVTVSKEIDLPDPIENAAVQVVKEAASRTAKEAGDGTTTSTVIACETASSGFKAVKKGANPMDVKRGIDLAAANAVNMIKHMSYEVEDGDIENIATISANNDPVIGKMIAGVFEKVGKTGAVRIEETQQSETTTDVIEGCQLNGGMLSPNFVNNTGKRTAEYSDALIFITDKKFETSFMELAPVIEVAAKEQKPIMIICGGMEGEPLGTLVFNKVKSQFPVVAVIAPEFGDKRMEILEDVAAITGGTVISEARGHKFDEVTIDNFGTADRVIASSEFTTIIGRHGEVPAMQKRVEMIGAQKEEDRNGQQAWYLNRRLATLTGGIGVIYVGGNSESETKESYFRIEDAVHATKAAMESGFVIGGGMAYWEIGEHLRGDYGESIPKSINKDTRKGYEALVNALFMPTFTIMKNSNASKLAWKQMTEMRPNDYGYDALNDKYCNLLDAGIIDPAKVVRSAIKNAASVAGMLITTDCIITNKQ
jgi:chaperonin GroEL